MLLRLLALAKASRSPTAVQSLVFAVTLLARLNTQREFVLARRQWTGRVGGEGAGWVVGPIEIQRHLAVARHIGIEESTASVSLGFVGLVPEDEKELVFARLHHRIQTVLLAINGKHRGSRRGHLIDRSQYVGHRERSRPTRWLERASIRHFAFAGYIGIA